MNKSFELDWNDGDVLPGFRFHPTDEELVNFYLRRKLEQKRLTFQLPIAELDIYKFDPWDLSKLTLFVESQKELYFFCPRDRKYRKSDKPNRVTASGFWKATSIDRPVYSMDGTKCVGLKKSLVFYTGKAAKGTKTDWMMHEFRMLCTGDRYRAKQIAQRMADTNWVVCRIFIKKGSSSKMISPFALQSPSPTEPELCAAGVTYSPPILHTRLPDNESQQHSNRGSVLPASSPNTRAEMSAVKSACKYIIKSSPEPESEPKPGTMADTVFVSSYSSEPSSRILRTECVTVSTCLVEEFPPLEQECMDSSRCMMMFMSPAISEFPLEEMGSSFT